MSAEDFNRKQYQSGKLTDGMIARLVRAWQDDHGLDVDGYAGANTIDSLLSASALVKFWPLASLTDGRKPQLTSGFYTENPSRPTHNGIDLFFEWLDSDPDMPTGDGGAIKKSGQRRWWIPPGTVAIAAASGIVQQASMIGTGHRVWVDHGNGERTGYFHGLALLVREGDKVAAGAPLITVGDNPKGHDASHLHFEVSPVDDYRPMNPRPWLSGAGFK